jgi:drug/metabolite transporter (DMT)-like permease
MAARLVALWARRRGLPLVHRDRTLLHGLAIGLLFGTEFVFIYLGLSYTTASRSVIFLWAATSLYLKRVVRTSMTPSQMLFYQLGFSAVQLSLMSLGFESRRILDLTPLVIGSLAYQGIIVAFASYLVRFWLIQVYPVSNVSAFTFFTPIFGVMLGGLLLNEPLTLKLLSGGAMVAAGMILVNWPGGQR